MQKTRRGGGLPVTGVGDGIPEFPWLAGLAQAVSSRFRDGTSCPDQSLTLRWAFPLSRDVLPSPAQGRSRIICCLHPRNFQSSWTPGTDLPWKEARHLCTGSRSQQSGGTGPKPRYLCSLCFGPPAADKMMQVLLQ